MQTSILLETYRKADEIEEDMEECQRDIDEPLPWVKYKKFTSRLKAPLLDSGE